MKKIKKKDDVEEEGETSHENALPAGYSFWLGYTIRANYTTGEETISYSHTPEELVAELRLRHERVIVSRGSCTECVYTPDRTIPRAFVQDFTDQVLAHHRIPECICVTASRRSVLRPHPVPNFVVCYGFYYQYWYKSKYLAAAKEAGLVTFYEVGDLPGLRETGLILINPPGFL